MFSKMIRLLVNGTIMLTLLTGTAAAERSRDKKVDLNKIPEEIQVEIRKVVYVDPITKYLAGEKRKFTEVIEFIVKAKEVIRPRAIGPVLIIGKRMVFNFHYKF